MPRAPDPGAVATRLDEVHGFGSNPGNLRMFSYVPPRLEAIPPSWSSLHGCTQTAAGYDLGAGWSTLADRFGFVLLLPEQQRSNNPNGCFNWFQPGDIERGSGEALLDPANGREDGDRPRYRPPPRVHHRTVGGRRDDVRHARAVIPDVFAGGAIVAGLPYGAASNVQQAFESMFQCPARVRARDGAISCEARRRITGRGRASRSGMAAPTRR